MKNKQKLLYSIIQMIIKNKIFYNKITYSIKVYRKYKVKIIIQEKLYM